MLPTATKARNPPDPTPGAPGILMLAARFGPQDQTTREFWTFGGFWKLRGIQKSLKKHGGDLWAPGGPGPDYQSQKSGPVRHQSQPSGSDPRGARSPHSSDPRRGAGSDAAELLDIWWVLEMAGIPENPEKSWRGSREPGGPVTDPGKLSSASC